MRSVGAYSYNANNQPQVSGYSFDNNGAPTLYGSQALAFDPEDHLTQIGPSGSASFKAGYSGGLRAWKETGGTRTYFLYSGGVPLIEMDVNGVVQAVNSFGAAGLLSRRTGGTGGPTTFYSFDPQGNVCQRLNSAAAVTSTDVYDAFGKGYRSPIGVNDAYGFGGQWGYYHDYDTPLGLHLLSYRYLDTQTGRFLTRDPVGYAGGGNLYRFVGNSPTSFADPSGLVERWQYVAGGAAVGGTAGAVLASPGGPGTAAGGAVLLGGVGGLIAGGLYDSAEDFGLAWGCYEGRRASGWQFAWSGTKAAYDLVSTAFLISAVAGPRGTGNTVNCFPAGTPVLTAAGEKPIEQIRAGDVVVSADALTGKLSLQRVEATFTNEAEELIRVSTEDGKSIAATPGHPFWVEGKGFVLAKHLARSDLLRDARGRLVRIAEVSERRGKVHVYNFSVERTHTYFAGGWWVHNDSNPDVEYSHPRELNPDPVELIEGRRSNRYFRSLVEDIKERGMKQPIEYYERNGVKWITDGHHRWRAANSLQLERVPVKRVPDPGD
jgi:RHS repeat-associated protein